MTDFVAPNSLQDPTHLDHNISQDMLMWVHEARKQKQRWVGTVGNSPKKCDMNPLIFPERDGVILAIILAPTLDRDQGLAAAVACRKCMKADAITMVMDCHVRSVDPKEVDTFKETYKHGDMQRACDEEGACETDAISDCLIAHRVTESGRVFMACLPYKYAVNPDGSHGPNFQWTPRLNMSMDSETQVRQGDEGLEVTLPQIEGTVPNAMRYIMKLPFIGEEIPYLEEAARGLSTARKMYHIQNAILKVLEEDGYGCVNLLNKDLIS